MTKPNLTAMLMLQSMIFAVMIIPIHLCASRMTILQATTMPEWTMHLFWKSIVILENREAMILISPTLMETLKTPAMTRFTAPVFTPRTLRPKDILLVNVESPKHCIWPHQFKPHPR